MTSKIPEGSDFSAKVQFFQSQISEGTSSQKVTTSSLGSTERTITSGEDNPVISGVVHQPRETNNLGKLDPPFSSHVTSPTVTKQLTTSEEEKTDTETKVEEKKPSEEGLEGKKEPKGKSTVKHETTLTHEVHSTAHDTGSAAFNALEKFVSIFSKTKAKEMLSTRLDAVAAKVTQHFMNGEIDKAGRVLANLAELSPLRFQEELKALQSSQTPQLIVTGEDDKQVRDRPTQVIEAAARYTLDKYDSHIRKRNMEKAGEALGTLGVISPSSFRSVVSESLPPDVLRAALAKLPIKECPAENGLVAFNLGKAVLRPVTTTDPNHENIQRAMHFIKAKGIDNPDKCGADLWRTMTRIKLFDGTSEQPLIDGTKISKEPPAKDLESSESMRTLLNHFFEQVTGRKEVIAKEFEGQDQMDATRLGEALGIVFEALRTSDEKTSATPLNVLLKKIDEEHMEALDHMADQTRERLDNEKDDEKSKDIQKRFNAAFVLTEQKNEDFKRMVTELFHAVQFLDGAPWEVMPLMFGLGAQELFTRPADWTIPEDLRKGDGKMQIAEFSAGNVEQLKPFEHVRGISITTKENGDLEYKISQPITFKDGNTNPIGTCRMETVLTFNSNMEIISFSQEVKPAQIKSK